MVFLAVAFESFVYSSGVPVFFSVHDEAAEYAAIIFVLAIHVAVHEAECWDLWESVGCEDAVGVDFEEGVVACE